MLEPGWGQSSKLLQTLSCPNTLQLLLSASRAHGVTAKAEGQKCQSQTHWWSPTWDLSAQPHLAATALTLEAKNLLEAKKKSQTQSALPSAKTKQDSVYNPLWNWCRKVKECIFLRFKVGFLAKICFPDGVIDLDSTESSQAAWRAWKFPGTWAGKSRESPQTGTGSASMGRNTDHVQEKGRSCSSQGVGKEGERESCNSQYIIFNGQHWFTVQFKILQVCRKFLQLFHHRKRILLY